MCNNLQKPLQQMILEYDQRQSESGFDYSSAKAYQLSTSRKQADWKSVLLGNLPALKLLSHTITPKNDLDEITLCFENGFTFRSLFKKPDKPAKSWPLVICLHGMNGTPEMVMGLDASLKHSYHDFGAKLTENGFAVTAPELVNNFHDRAIINRLSLLLGFHIWSLESFAILEFIKFITFEYNIDDNKISLWGISMGGGYTLYTLPVEQKIKLGIISAWFNKRPEKMVVENPNYSCFLSTEEEHAFLPGLLTQFSDADLVSLACPRPVQVQTGEKDNVAWPPLVKKEIEKAAAHYNRLGIKEKFDWCLHNGDHEIDFENGLNFMNKWLF